MGPDQFVQKVEREILHVQHAAAQSIPLLDKAAGHRVTFDYSYGYTSGGKTYDMLLRGRKVGTYSIRFSKAEHRTTVAIVDEDAFAQWAFGNGLARKQVVITLDVEEGMPDRLIGQKITITEDMFLKGVARQNYIVSDNAIATAQRDGEIPDGCEARVIDEPAVPIGSTLRIDPVLVAQAMGSELPSAVMGLLSEGGE